jgi:hypothetical protein
VATDKKIKGYIGKQKCLQRAILSKVRRIFLRTLPHHNEKFAWGVITFAGGKFYLGAIGDRVHVGFAIDGLNKKEISLFEGSGRTMRHIKIYSLKDLDEKKLVNLIKLVDKKAACGPC